MLKNKQPLVSIVIPAYNAMPYIEEAIASVLAQTYPHIELIVLDDGSSDNTAAFLKKYTGVFYFETQANCGQAETLNKGWRLCKGEIIGYLSADDVLLPEAVSAAVAGFLADPEVVLTYPNNQLIDSHSRVIRAVMNLPNYDYYTLVQYGYKICFVGALFLKSAFEQIGGWNKNYRSTADLEYFLRLAQLGKFQHINQVLANYRVHSQTISSSKASFQQAEEYKVLIETIVGSTNDAKLLQIKNKSLSFAYLIAGRTHWRAGRLKIFSSYFVKSIRIYPKILLFPQTYRIILNALINQNLHKLLKSAYNVLGRRKNS